MQTPRVLVACVALTASSMASAEELKLPPEVTPALRAACEGDVRRLGCIDDTPTYAEVKSCVVSKYVRLGNRCKVQLAVAGYAGPSNVPKSTGEKSAGEKPATVKAAQTAKPRTAGFLAIFD
jgi:hypothetical protein